MEWSLGTLNCERCAWDAWDCCIGVSSSVAAPHLPGWRRELRSCMACLATPVIFVPHATASLLSLSRRPAGSAEGCPLPPPVSPPSAGSAFSASLRELSGCIRDRLKTAHPRGGCVEHENSVDAGIIHTRLSLFFFCLTSRLPWDKCLALIPSRS